MRTLLILSSLFLLFGCKTLPPPVTLTETKSGEQVMEYEIQQTESRKDVPVNVDPRDVVAKVETKTGAKAWVVDKQRWNPFNDVQVFKNEQAKVEDLKIAQPKSPWWKWPVTVLIFIAVLAVVVFLDKIRKLVFFWRRG